MHSKNKVFPPWNSEVRSGDGKPFKGLKRIVEENHVLSRQEMEKRIPKTPAKVLKKMLDEVKGYNPKTLGEIDEEKGIEDMDDESTLIQ